MQTLRAQYKAFREGQHIGLDAYYIDERPVTNDNARQVKGAITRQVKRKLEWLGADNAEVYLLYSCQPSGPFLTEFRKVQP